MVADITRKTLSDGTTSKSRSWQSEIDALGVSPCKPAHVNLVDLMLNSGLSGSHPVIAMARIERTDRFRKIEIAA
ncbi:MAG: hypothetical protein Devi2KO_04030 [Devosia indica]